MRVTAVIPTYNEAENLPSLIAALMALPLELSAIVVDDENAQLEWQRHQRSDQGRQVLCLVVSGDDRRDAHGC